MNGDKPKNIKEYREWLKAELGVEISHRDEMHYDSATAKVKRDFEQSAFWINLVKNYEEFDSQYQLQKGVPLWMQNLKPELQVKTFTSFELKTFRKNVLENKNWPNEIDDGWILPKNWYSRINDVVRTLFVVRYLDGVQFVIDKVQNLCRQQGLPACEVSFEAREEGYYAAHLYTTQEFEIPKVTWDTERVKISIEVQITTQLQEIIRKLLHKYYEERRKRLEKDDVKWQWNYKSDEFATNYLGHILHYVEGMIMDIREKQKEKIP